MSTKTTFKRLALVTVAALGLGVMSSVAPAQATASGGFTLDTTSITVVTAVESATAVFKLKLTDIAGDPQDLEADETITATIVGVPAGTGTAKTLAANGNWSTTSTNATQAADLTFTSLKQPTTRTGAYVAQSGVGTSSWGGNIDASHTASTDSATSATVSAVDSVYYLGVRNTLAATSGTNASVDQGAYTIRVRLTVGGFVVKEQNVTVKFVSAAADSGAAFTITQTGALYKDKIDTYTTTNNLKVVMTNGTAGGRVIAGLNSLVSRSAVPAVALVLDADSTVVSTTNFDGTAGLAIADTGVDGNDGVFTGTYASYAADLANNDGTFGVYTTHADALDTVSVTAATSLRVRYGATETTKTLTFNSPATATAAGSTAYVTATGMNVLASSGTLAAQRAFKVPTSNKTVGYSILATTGSAAVPDYPLVFTVTWSGNQAAADVTPVSGSTGKQTVRTDATGLASITLTNASPQDGAIATISVTGFANDTQAISQTITWADAAPTTVAVSPGAYTAALKSTNTLSVTVLDQFNSPMSGIVLQPAFSATTNANYVAAPATITTGANGVATFTWTDAGVAGSDTVSFRVVKNQVVSSGVKVTYASTAATIGSFKTYYSLTESDTTATTLVPSTGVDTTTATGLVPTLTRTNNKTISLTGADALSNDLVFYYVQALTSAGAAAAYAPVTITAPAGAFVLNSSALEVSSTTAVTDINGYVGFVGGSNATGSIVYTVAAGTVSKTITTSVANTAAAGRYVTVTGPATGTANGELNLYSGTVTDRNGNGVADVSVTVSASGASNLGGGSTSASYVTDADGKFSFTGTSLSSAGGAGKFTATATTAGDYASVAGYVGSTTVESTVKAGNKTASVSVTWAEGSSAATTAASAAADAAAEATDAANAATDAANAAAEAADAATAAAQDAADAVAALSAQVSSMMSSLKAQLTALTNLVIKIQKKVKA
jgi:hypothetical protein